MPMKNIFYKATVMWAQIDANQHMRHSAYADFGAQARMALLNKLGLPADIFLKNNRGPILFREELVYIKEINMNETISVSCELVKSKKDGSKWTIKHHIFNSKQEISAIITVDGAWIDLNKRKIAALPENMLHLFMGIPKSDGFVEE